MKLLIQKASLLLRQKKFYTGKFLIIWVVLVGLLGASVFAVLPHISIEAESGTLTTGVVTVSDTQASGGSYVRFDQPSTGTCSAGQVGTPPNCFSANSALGVSAGQVVNSFDRRIKGVGLANWTFTNSWGKPFVGDIQGLPQVIEAIDPGLIRYAGGLWANYVGFDGGIQRPAQTAWTRNGLTYYFSYGTDELIDLDAFAKSVNAEVMIQVNISNNDPAMWADLVRFVKNNNLTSIKYYEFGNELDLETAVGNSTAITPATYASRLAAYQQAMMAVDSTIKIVGGVPAGASDVIRNNWGSGGNSVSQYITQGLSAARSAGRDLNAASFHWYQTSDATSIADIIRWTWDIPSSSGEWWRQSYSRAWANDVGPWIRSSAMGSYANTQLGVSELGVNSSDNITFNANHIAALWYSDVLGRMAYNDIDWVTQWNSYASSGEYFSIIYPNSDQTTTPTIHLRPTYYAYLMYSKYFGDQMVGSSTNDPTRISIWASKDTDDPNKLKLRITNLSDAPVTIPVALSGFSASSGQAYVLSSTNPTDSSTSSTTSTAPTSINGVKLNGNNVASGLASIQPTNVSVSGTTFNYTFPAYSSTAIVLTGTFQ